MLKSGKKFVFQNLPKTCLQQNVNAANFLHIVKIIENCSKKIFLAKSKFCHILSKKNLQLKQFNKKKHFEQNVYFVTFWQKFYEKNSTSKFCHILSKKNLQLAIKIEKM